MSSTQIDSLNIRIESTSRDATAAIDALIQSFEKLKTAGNFKEIEKSLKKISDATNKGLKKVPETFDKAAKSADKLSSSMKKASSSASGLKGAFSGVVSGLLQLAGNAIGIHTTTDLLIEASKAAMEWEGISARFGEGFGEQADEAYEHVLKLQDALYVNDQQFMQYASNFATLGKGMGVPTKYIKDMSIGMTELAYDIFAKNNDFYDLEEALLAVRSAFLGEIEPIRKAGISITEATLKEAAANYGLTMSVEKMTEAQKMQLRYKVMLDQAYASSTVGTYISEIDTAEGSFRALGQQIKGLVQTLGGLLMPVVSAVLPYLQAFVSLLTMAIRAVATFFGISIKAPTWGMDSLASGAGSATDAVEGTTDALGSAAKAAKKLKDYTMGFDELNVVKPQQDTSGSGSGVGGGGIGGDLGLDIESLWTDAMIADANMKAEAVKENILNTLKPIKDAISQIDFKPLTNSLSNLWDALKPFAAEVGQGLYWFLMNVLIPLAGFTIESVLPTFLNSLTDALNWLTPILDAFNTSVANADYSGLATEIERIAKALGFGSGSGSETGAESPVINGLDEVSAAKIDESVGNSLGIIETALSGVASVLEWVVPRLKEFGSWVVENRDHIATVAGYVAAFFAAFKAVTWVTSAISAIGGVSSVVSGLTTFLANLLIRAQAATIIFGSSAGGLGAVFSVLSSVLSSIISAVFSPLVLIVTAIASTAMVLAANWDKVVQTFKNFIDNIDLSGKFDAIMAALAPMMEKLAGLKDLFTAIGTIGTTVLAAAMTIVAGVFNAILSALPGLIQLFGGLVDILAAVGSWLLSVVEFFGTMVQAVVALVTGDFSGAIDLAKQAFVGLYEDAKAYLDKLWEGVVGVFGGLWNAIGGLLGGFVDGVIAFFKGLWDTLVGHSIVPDTIDAIVEYFASLPKKIFSGLKSFVNDVIDYFKDMWSGVTDTWKSVAEWFGTQFKNAWTNIKNAWSSVKTWFSTLWTNIKNVFSTVATWFKTQFANAWTNIKAAFSNSVIGDYFSTLWNTIKNIFSVVKSVLTGNFSDAWTGIKNVFSGWATFFSGLWDKIKSTFSGLGTTLGDAIGGSVKTALNKVLSSIESTINKAIGLINSAITVINKLPGVSVSKISTISIPRLATGGFVDEGQLFIAREAGAEMVGSMNNRTTVANNDQIVEGISAGVYSAVLAAMSQTNGNNTEGINVYLDGKQITAAVEKRQRERGANIMTGGVTFGY